jgi:hypothetical protein
MDPSYDHDLLARILLTLMTAGYGLLTVNADFNRTHATNPLWTPHARFHVVWQISSYVGFGLLAFALIWVPGPLYVERFYLVCAFGLVVYGAFFAAFFAAFLAMPVYGGKVYGENGYPPFAVELFGKKLKLDVNATAFSIFTLILIAGALSIGRAVS